MISKFDFKNKPMIAHYGICPRCGCNGGGGDLWKIIAIDNSMTVRGFWCDECDAFFPEDVGIYKPSPERPMGSNLGSYLENRGMDRNSQLFYEH